MSIRLLNSRLRATARIVDRLGLPEYYAMEAIVVRGAGPAAASWLL